MISSISLKYIVSLIQSVEVYSYIPVLQDLGLHGSSKANAGQITVVAPSLSEGRVQSCMRKWAVAVTALEGLVLDAALHLPISLGIGVSTAGQGSPYLPGWGTGGAVARGVDLLGRRWPA